MKTKLSADGRQGRTVHTKAGSLGRPLTDLAPYQTRTCARCGRHTTFVLEDAAGGWYSCIECGRYA